VADKQPKVIRAWEWKKNIHGDPCTLHCDLIDYCQLDFYGESHHPLWKGWFDIGKIALQEFLEKGPPAVAESMPKKVRTEVAAFINELRKKNLIEPPPPVVEYVPEIIPSDIPYMYKPPPDPLDVAGKETCALTIWVEVPGFPEMRLTDLTISLGSRTYERHEYDDRESPLQKAARLLVVAGPAACGDYRISVHAELARRGVAGVEAAPCIQEVPVRLGAKNSSLYIICEASGIRLIQKERATTETIRIRLTLPHFPRVRLGGLAIWQKNTLLWQERHESPTYFFNFLRPNKPLIEEWQLESPEIPLPDKKENLHATFWYYFEDEPDLRSVELMAPPGSIVTFTVPPELPKPSAAQLKKRKEMTALESEIMDCIRNGMTFHTADKEGGWMEIGWQGGGFQQSGGSYASGSRDNGSITETAALKAMLESTAMGFIRADRLTLLKSLKSSLREKR